MFYSDKSVSSRGFTWPIMLPFSTMYISTFAASKVSKELLTMLVLQFDEKQYQAFVTPKSEAMNDSQFMKPFVLIPTFKFLSNSWIENNNVF
ncbi:MAG: hypothetical protein IPL22_20695 [Bacteroidetes bacterium]|nr:hypothetical protein [Bacteroidota bacterium]